MELRTDQTKIEVIPGAFIFDEQSDTFVEWDQLDSDNQAFIELLTTELETKTNGLRSVIKAAGLGIKTQKRTESAPMS